MFNVFTKEISYTFISDKTIILWIRTERYSGDKKNVQKAFNAKLIILKDCQKPLLLFRNIMQESTGHVKNLFLYIW